MTRSRVTTNTAAAMANKNHHSSAMRTAGPSGVSKFGVPGQVTVGSASRL